MKKLIISMFALAAVLVSCSKSAVVEVPFENIPISFSSYNGKTPTVKASAFEKVDSLAHYGFQVYAYLHNTAESDPVYTVGSEYMDKVVKGTYADEKWSWKYDGMSYWPGTLYLDFVAYGLNAENVLTPDNANSNKLAVVIPTTVAEQKDVLVAVPHKDVQYTTGEGANNGTVALNFKHLLSRVSFALVTKDGNGVDVTIEEIKLSGNFNTSGNIDLTTDTPTIVANTPEKSTDYSFLGNNTFTSTGNTEDKGGADIFDNSMLWVFNPGKVDDKGNNITSNDDKYDEIVKPTKAEDETDDEFAAREKEYNALVQASQKNFENRYMMIMPTIGDSHKAKLFVKYFLPEAGSYNAKEDGIDLSSINFEAGKSYKFLLKVSTNTIDFSVEITPWDEVSTNIGEKTVIELN